jgi:2-polyprenyl-3-methyl-5-hydroxy-6-metoxy-1,4-benzoquinol methylase
MRNLIRKIPGARRAYRHVAYLWSIAHQQWLRDWKQMTDESHLRKDWNFESSIEQERHELVLAAIRRLKADISQANVLEIGCSDGVFTARLAESCASVTACEISPVACELTSRRVRKFKNVVIKEFDIVHENIPARYDIIFAMDVLEYVHGRKNFQTVVTKLIDALNPQGLLAYSDCRLLPELQDAWWQRWLPEGGDAVVKRIASYPALRMEHWEFHPNDGLSVKDYYAHVLAVFSKK